MLLSIPVTVALNPGLATDLFDLNFKIIVFAWKCERIYVVKKKLDPVGSTVRYEMTKLCTGSV